MKLSMILISLIVFSMVTAGLYLVPMLDNASGGYNFFKAYGYTPPASNLTEFDYTSETYKKIQAIKCDLNPDNDECPQVKKNVFLQITEFINGMVQGGYGALITLSKTIGLFDAIISDVAVIIGIPEIIWKGFISILTVSILITIILIIFNRSDAG